MRAVHTIFLFLAFCVVALYSGSSFAAAPVVKIFGTASGQEVPDTSLSSVTLECQRSDGGAAMLAEGPPSYTSGTTTDGFPTASSFCGKWVGTVWQRTASGKRSVAGKYVCITSTDPNVYANPNTSQPFDQQCPAPTPTDPGGGGGTASCVAGVTGESTWAMGHGPAGVNSPSGGPGVLPTTNGQCEIFVTEVVKCYSTLSASGGQDFYCRYKWMQTGDVLVGESGAPVTPPSGATKPAVTETKADIPNPCPRGTSQIGTDSSGIPMCRGNGTAPDVKTPEVTKKPPTTTTNADGSTTKTETTEVKNADGSITTKTTTTTTDADGNETTVTNETTGSKADGTTGTEDAGEKDKNDLCKLYPNLNICNNSTVGGACETTSCTGDAITCAIARSNADQLCRQKKADEEIKASAQYVLGNQVLNGTDPAAATLPHKGNALGVNVGGLSTTGFLSGGSCFQDKTVTVQGRSFTLPFSQTCQYLIVFRYAVMLVALFASFRMLSGAVIRD